jgi:excinuclease ABC subunit C
MTFDPSKLDTFSTQPGVYIMKTTASDVLYIGKAKNLRARIKQYFQRGGDGRPIIPFLVAKVDAIDILIVKSEKEALLLENNLIKKHQPRYNALLKDDKTYIALKVTAKSKWPTVQLVRYRGKPEPDGLYFGPYTSAHAARTTLDLINRLFPLRQCSDAELARRTRPCILYDMKRCIAPCVQKCTPEEYQQLVERVVKFLRGQDKVVLQELYDEMYQASESLEFEKAGLILKTIKQIEQTIESQNVDKPLGSDSDAIAIFRQGNEVMLSKLIFREGKLVSMRHHDFAQIAQDDDEILKTYLLQHYEQQEQLPHEILLPIPIEDAEIIAEILSQNKKRKTRIFVPQRGDKRELVEMAYVNAEASFKKEKDEQAIRERTLLEMQEQLHLIHYPSRIECFDNSNLAGTELVSCMVAFTDGEKERSRYRKYKMRTVIGQDDYASMREVLMRRYKRAEIENDFPDLLIIDGGQGHLNVALQVFAELNIITVDVIGIAKEQGRHDKGMTAEQVFLPKMKEPIRLKHTSPILFFLQQVRDEAHRFAIEFQRKRRSLTTLKTSLEDIPGIGPVKRKMLLRHFGSVKKLLEATPEELGKVKGLSQANIQAIETWITNMDNKHR